MKPMDQWLFPRPSAGYELHKVFHNNHNNGNGEVTSAVDGDRCTIRPMASNPEAAFRKSSCVEPSARSPLSLAAVLQQAKCNGNSLFQAAASSAMLSMPGKDFVAIADIVRVDLVTRPPSIYTPGAPVGDDQVRTIPTVTFKWMDELLRLQG
jgi:hypothetical protein